MDMVSSDDETKTRPERQDGERSGNQKWTIVKKASKRKKQASLSGEGEMKLKESTMKAC